jgi:hypothetical protein
VTLSDCHCEDAPCRSCRKSLNRPAYLWSLPTHEGCISSGIIELLTRPRRSILGQARNLIFSYRVKTYLQNPIVIKGPHSTTDAWFSSQEYTDKDDATRGKRKHDDRKETGEAESSRSVVSSKSSRKSRKRAREAAMKETTEVHGSDHEPADIIEERPPHSITPQARSSSVKNDLRSSPQQNLVQKSSPHRQVRGIDNYRRNNTENKQHPPGTIKDLMLGRCPLVIGIVKDIADIRQTITGGQSTT